MGLRVPVFAHLSMILGADGKRLSKRHGATSVEAYRDLGFLPEALMNYLALLGWSLDGETTVIDAETLCENFSLDRISKNPAIFDEEKLEWMNGVYLREMPAEQFVERMLPWLVEAGLCDADELSRAPRLVPAPRPPRLRARQAAGRGRRQGRIPVRRAGRSMRPRARRC